MNRRSSYELDERAAEATFLVNHPLLNEAFDKLHNSYMEQVVSTTGDEMLSAHSKLRVVQEVREYLRSIITDKKMADRKGIKYG